MHWLICSMCLRLPDVHFINMLVVVRLPYALKKNSYAKTLGYLCIEATSCYGNMFIVLSLPCAVGNMFNVFCLLYALFNMFNLLWLLKCIS